MMTSTPITAAKPSLNTDFIPAEPIYQRKKRLHWWIWIVPALVAIGAGMYMRDFLEQRGPVIHVEISNADGLKVGDSPVLHRGVMIGKVASISLTKDKKKALVELRLHKGEEAFAREGAAFWIVRPEVSGTALEGLGTLFSGPYIDTTPGQGEQKEEFLGLTKPPVYFPEGLELVVHAAHLPHLEESSPVYYRGEQVGVVRDVRLSKNANLVEAHLTIWRRYSPLVRSSSKFWPVTGFDVKGGIFSGIQMQLSSLKALVSGGIAFATPEKNMGGEVKNGTDFALEKEAKDDWLNWSPQIPISPNVNQSGDNDESAIKNAERVTSMAKDKH
jgi:paraquat-inducible protein B